jgi:hypothetical protein
MHPNIDRQQPNELWQRRQNLPNYESLGQSPDVLVVNTAISKSYKSLFLSKIKLFRNVILEIRHSALILLLKKTFNQKYAFQSIFFPAYENCLENKVGNILEGF